MKKYFIVILSMLLFSCNIWGPEKFENPLFRKTDAEQSGIHFVNKVIDTKQLSILDYLYFYNGGGVAAGDINNDGLVDLFFTSNLNDNKLFLNKGGLRFVDISEQACIIGNADWNTGAVMVDVNGDGWLDIYVCAVVGIHHFEGSNELYINNKDNTFTESAATYGLDIKNYSSNAAFLDYDKDGDLDMYLLNHAVHTLDSYIPLEKARAKYVYESSDKLYRNDKNTFKDVSRQSGLIGGAISYGLGVRIADFNNDGWDDIFVSNDFHEDDYLYINQRNGSFKESGKDYFAHISNFSMGNDVADINNDGYLDLMVLDMLPEDEKVIKTSVSDMAYDIYQFRLRYGYNHQFARNVLQLNNQGKTFSEIALMSGVSATDWSWSPLFADYDNDGIQDLFISTGIFRRPNNLDYIKYISNEQVKKTFESTHFLDEKALDKMPEGKVHNYIFKGTKQRFLQKHVQWGMSDANISTGAAIADLDNDGDMDIVVNCLNEPSFIYENTARSDSTATLQIKLHGKTPNHFGIGAKVYVYTNGQMQFQQLNPYRGFQSSSQPIFHFGLNNLSPDSLLVIWGDDTFQKIENPNTNSILVLEQKNANGKFDYNVSDSHQKSIFKNISDRLSFIHKENYFFDFNREKLMQYLVSTQGPALAVADVNNDGTDDIYIGGARKQAGVLYMQLHDGSFVEKNTDVFQQDLDYEDVDAVFADIDNDNDDDLIVASAGNEFRGNAKQLSDRIYLNDGKGNFTKKELFPTYTENTACIRPADIDNDGDLDLFVGGRVDASGFGKIPNSYLFINDGRGKYTEQSVKNLKKVGMVTDALWNDFDNDNDVDLFIVGEWMKPRLFENNKGQLTETTERFTHDFPTGLWQEVELYDIDNDGDKDILLGNWGLNTKLTASKKYPLKMFIKDIDENGTIEQIFTYAKEGKYYPIHTKDELCSQIVKLNKRFTKYDEYAGKTIEEIFSDSELKDAKILMVETLESAFLQNENGKYTFKKLPFSLQDAPVFKFYTCDFDGDKKDDLLIAGNLHGVIPYHGKLDANYGKVILAARPMEVVTSKKFEINFFNKEIRNIHSLKIGNNDGFIVAVNNNRSMLIQIQQ